jgi:kinesin family protein 2/24
MSSTLFLDTLRKAGLEEFYLNFTMAGINSLEGLRQLKPSDYSTYGIVSANDRKKMSALFETLTKKGMSVCLVIPIVSNNCNLLPKDPTPVLPSSKSASFTEPSAHQSVNNTIAIDQSQPDRAMTPSKRPASSRKPVATSGFTSAGLNAYGVPVNFAKASISDKENAKSGTAVDLSADFPAEDPPAERIKVCVRKRPLNNKEIAKAEKDITEVASRKTILVHEPKYGRFVFGLFIHMSMNK